MRDMQSSLSRIDEKKEGVKGMSSKISNPMTSTPDVSAHTLERIRSLRCHLVTKISKKIASLFIPVGEQTCSLMTNMADQPANHLNEVENRGRRRAL